LVQEFCRYNDKGRPITLTSEAGFGYQQKSTIDSLKALAAEPLATYTLTITPHSGSAYTATVRFRNEVSGGAVQFSPAMVWDGIPTSTFWYSGTVYLMVV